MNDDRSSWIAAFYVQDEYAIHKRFVLVAGLRSDWNKKYEITQSPRLGVVFQAGSSTDLKANYSWASRAPNSYETFYSVKVSNTGESAAETGKDAQLGIGFGPPVRKEVPIFRRGFSEPN